MIAYLASGGHYWDSALPLWLQVVISLAAILIPLAIIGWIVSSFRYRAERKRSLEMSQRLSRSGSLRYMNDDPEVNWKQAQLDKQDEIIDLLRRQDPNSPW